MPRRPSVDEITRLALSAFRRLQTLIEQNRFSEIVDDINARWGEARRVELVLTGRAEPVSGYFRGVDPEGRLSFMEHGAGPLILDASQVALLREIG
jgi:biotin-(acetyl-CoA carboxylase) ligase